MRKLPLLLLLMPAAALAHGGAHEIEGGAPGWTADPWVLVPLLVFGGCYALGASRLWQRSGLGRGGLKRDALLFLGGWLTLAGAVLSPLHEAGERSFTFHMIEHELIMLVASLLLVASRPAAALLWAFPPTMRRGFGSAAQWAWLGAIWRFLSDPVIATLLQAIAMWAWHVPALFDRALGHQSWHVAQHLSFLATSLIFWWAMANGRDGRHGYGVSAICLFVTSLVGGALGALMAFSASPWYSGYAAMKMTLGGLSPAEDQQLAGLIMWIPGGLVHAGAALFFLAKWLQASGRRHAVEAR